MAASYLVPALNPPDAAGLQPRTVPSWKAHSLTGRRKGTWSLFVTKNWRITFRIDQDQIEIVDLDYEDYH